VTGDGTAEQGFAFDNQLVPSGDAYSITVTDPTVPAQLCEVKSGGSGTASGPISVVIECQVRTSSSRST
jgi:hypothetical protein